VTVVHDSAILKVVFEVWMSLAQLYPFLNRQPAVVIHLLRVLLWLFVKRIDGDSYVVTDSISLDRVRLEAVLFWSVIHAMERGEVRRLVTSDVSCALEQLADFLFVVLPACFGLVYSGDTTPQQAMALHMMTYMGSILPLPDCANVWIVAFSRENPMNFLNAIFIAAFFFTAASQTVSIQAVQEVVQVADSRELIAAALRFHAQYINIVRQELEKKMR
jgi:hypothetical protein